MATRYSIQRRSEVPRKLRAINSRTARPRVESFTGFLLRRAVRSILGQRQRPRKQASGRQTDGIKVMQLARAVLAPRLMPIALSNPVKYLRGVGPQRAATLEERGILRVADLLGYLPFRYEDRLRFTPIAEIIPGQVHTIFAEVSGGGGTTVRFARSRRSIFHVAVRDASGTVHVRFFHGGYLEGRLKDGQKLVLHGKVDE